MSYTNTFNAVKQHMADTLKAENLYVENDSDTGGLSVSLTQFGLSTVYATITANEINYYIENLEPEDLNVILAEQKGKEQ